MSSSHLLRHLHLPSTTPFTVAQNLQAGLVSRLLSYKALVSSPTPPSPLPPAPQPTLLTFSPSPVYTTGRRELGTLSKSQLTSLQQPLSPLSPLVPAVHDTLRGGRITFHGPGQLVIYPVIDLRAVGLGARCYVHLLEAATIGTLARFGVRGIRTDNPGVWVDEETKIAALGVHLRRSVTSYGVGLNVATDLRWFDRIVACGLEGKRTTSMEAQGVGMEGGGDESLARVAEVWADEFAQGLWGDEKRVEKIMDTELLGDSS